MKVFKAGVAKVDITPPLGSLINGDFVTHYARNIHDPLFSKCLVLQNGNEMIAFIVVDICFMKKDFIEHVKSEIEQKGGIDKKNLLIAATHTHAAGSIEPGLLGEADLSYRLSLKKKLVESFFVAFHNLREAEVAFGKAMVPEHVVCRRYFMKEGFKAFNPVTNGFDKIKTNPGGYEDMIEKRSGNPDPEVCFLALRDMEGKWISVLANYSMHYVGDWPNGTITGDYFSVFDRRMKEMLHAPEDFVAIMTNGTSGDANIVDLLNPNRYPKENFKKSELIGSNIAEKIVSSVGKLEWERDPEIEAEIKFLDVEVRKPSKEELDEAKAIVKETYYEHLKIHDAQDLSSHTGKNEDFQRIYAREQVLLNEYPDTISFPIQAFRIGSVKIGALGGEFFSETGLWLKKEVSTEKYFTICLANDYVGYVPPEHEFENGGYETWRSRGSYLAIKSEEVIRTKVFSLM